MNKNALYLLTVILAVLCVGCGFSDRQHRAEDIRNSAREKLAQGKTYLLEDGLTEALSYYAEAADTSNLIEMNRLAAIQMIWKGEQDSAAICLHRALDLAKENSSPAVSDIYLELADLYSRPLSVKDYAKAIDYAHKAEEADSGAEHKAGILHDIGVYYAFLAEEDSATSYLEKALALTPSNSSAYTQLALNYAGLPEPDFDKSIAYLDQIRTESLGKLITKGFLYLNRGMVDSASVYARMSQKLYDAGADKYSVNTYNSLRLLRNCVSYAADGRVFPGEGTVINDSIGERMALYRMIESESAEHEAALEIELLESESKAQRVIIVALLVVLIGGAGVGFMFWRNKRKYIKLHEEFDRLKQNQIMIEADDSNQDNSRPFHIIARRAEMSVDRFRQTGAPELIQKGEIDYNDSNAFLSVKDRTAVRQALLDCFADFIIDLKMDAGRLTMDDIITVLLSVLRVSNSGVAASLGVSVGAVRTRKTRLKGKLSPEMAKLVFG